MKTPLPAFRRCRLHKESRLTVRLARCFSAIRHPEPSEWIGASGRHYQFQTVLQEREQFGQVLSATSGGKTFVLKTVPGEIYLNFTHVIRPQLRYCPNIRLPCDYIPNQPMIVYNHLKCNLLSFARRGLPIRTRKQILKSALRGLVELHDCDVVHLDVKPDNILVDYRREGKDVVIERVQIIDFENAAHLPEGRCISGMLPGNDNWRSPEGHLRSRLDRSTDIFSFGTLCIYVMLGRIIFGPDADFEKHVAGGALPEMIRLQRQISFFPERNSFNGLIKHVADDELSCQILGMLWDDRDADYHHYKAFENWENLEDISFKSLIVQMMQLDPRKRITAEQALEHAWFRGLDLE